MTTSRGNFGWGVGAKLTLMTFLLVGVILAALVGGIGYSTSKLLEDRAVAHVADQAREVTDMIQMFDQGVSTSVQRFSRMFVGSFPDGLSLDASKSIELGGRETPALRHGASILNGEFTIPDRFTERTGVTATVFVRSGQDFVRISTSLKKENGERAVGTVLDRSHPAHALLLAGKGYRGLAQLFGKDFMTDYEPVRDAQGNVIGALYVGLNIADDMAILKQKIRALKVGETGYFYVLDGRPGKTLGTLLVHPAKEGQIILDMKDSDGRAFIREMLDKREGVVRYPWINKEKGETTAREKVVAYQEYRDWGWVIGGAPIRRRSRRNSPGCAICTCSRWHWRWASLPSCCMSRYGSWSRGHCPRPTCWHSAWRPAT